MHPVDVQFWNFQMFYYARKENKFNILAVSSLLVITLSSCSNAIFLKDFTLLNKKGFIAFSEALVFPSGLGKHLF